MSARIEKKAFKLRVRNLVVVRNSQVDGRKIICAYATIGPYKVSISKDKFSCDCKYASIQPDKMCSHKRAFSNRIRREEDRNLIESLVGEEKVKKHESIW